MGKPKGRYGREHVSQFQFVLPASRGRHRSAKSLYLRYSLCVPTSRVVTQEPSMRKYDSQICFDYHAINGMPGLSRELMDFVCAERRMERIALERLPCSLNRCLLRWVKAVKISP